MYSKNALRSRRGMLTQSVHEQHESEWGEHAGLDSHAPQENSQGGVLRSNGHRRVLMHASVLNCSDRDRHPNQGDEPPDDAAHPPVSRVFIFRHGFGDDDRGL